MDEPEGQRIGLARITLADRPAFDRAFARLSQPVSDYSFANTFLWGGCLKLYQLRTERHLCVFANGAGDLTMLMPPLPEDGATEADLRAALQHGFEAMDRYNDVHVTRAHSRIEYVSEELLEQINAVTGRGFVLSATPMSGDYVYDTARMIDLAGGALKSKRHARTRFMRHFPDHRTETLGPHHAPECLALLATWLTTSDDDHVGEVTSDTQLGTDILRDKEIDACRMALEHFEALDLTGLVLYVGQRMAGFTIGERLTSRQASVLFEKTHPDFPGAAQFIFSEFCRLCWAAYPECNAGDDWGIASLRFAKSTYRPIRMLGKSMLTRQPVVVTAAPGFSPSALPEASPMARVLGAAPNVADESDAVLRPAAAADLDAIVELERASFRAIEESFNRRQIRDLIRNPRVRVVVADVNGRLGGWAVGLIRQHRKNRSGRLYALAVHPGHRGRGLGQRLVTRIIDELTGQGIDKLYLEVRHDNQPAIALYERLGFTAQTLLPDYYGDGRHGFRMKISLTPAAKTAVLMALPANEATSPVPV